MMGEVIKEKGLPYELIAVDPTEDCPAHRVLKEQIIGDYKDEEQIRKLGEKSDLITFEIELANSQVLKELQKNGMPVNPTPETLKMIQDKFTQASFLRENNLPVPDFEKIEGLEDLEKAVETYGIPLMIKARKDSYDGKGNFVLRSKEDMEKALNYFEGRELMAQEFIPFDTEVSVISARSTQGEVSTFPVGENIHGADYNILETTIVPARVSEEVIKKAKAIAEKTMEAMKGAGVFGIEMLVKEGEVLINEIAPRVHNSGHYSVEACQTSQFEQHIKAIAGEKLGSTDLVSNAALMGNIIGKENERGTYEILYKEAPVSGTKEVEEGVFIHHYGKHETKPYRKIGHFTVLSLPDETQDELIKRVEQIKDQIEIRSN